MKKDKMTKIALTVFCGLVLSACSSNKVDSNTEKQINEKIETNLTKSINDIVMALDEIQNINRGVKPVVDNKKAIDKTVAARPKGEVSKEVSIATQTPKATVAQDKIKVETKKLDAKSSVGKKVILSDLDRKVNLGWDGDAANLISGLAKKINFKFEEQGTKQVLPIKIDVKNKTIKEVLSLIDSQTKTKADIKVSSVNKSIIIMYK